MNKNQLISFGLGCVVTTAVFGGVFFATRIQAGAPAAGREASSVTAAPLPPAPGGEAALKAPARPVHPAAAPTSARPEPAASTAAVSGAPASVETPAFRAMLSGEPAAKMRLHTVASGETLTGISKKYQVTIDLIKRVNALASDRLSVGQKLKIPSYRFSLVVDKSQNTMILKGDEEVLKTYAVSTGENNSTPVGVFKITDKLIHPTWYRPDGKVIPYGNPEHVLGTRWLGFTAKGYGIHGTVEPDKIGQQVTDGCVRMRNEEVEELFGLVPSGIEATVVD